jgi:hypothetical protein
LSRIVNNSNMAAVHQTIQVHSVHQQQVVQNVRIQRQLLLQVAQQVAATPATVEDIQELAEISRTAEQQGLDFAQVVARIQDSTPFAVLVDLLPRDRTELYALLAVLVAVLQLILNQQPTKVEVVSPDQVERIIERVIEHQEQSEQPEPPPTTKPDCSLSGSSWRSSQASTSDFLVAVANAVRLATRSPLCSGQTQTRANGNGQGSRDERQPSPRAD